MKPFEVIGQGHRKYLVNNCVYHIIFNDSNRMYKWEVRKGQGREWTLEDRFATRGDAERFLDDVKQGII